MLSGESITVPNYQRAYSWDTGSDGGNTKQVNVFLSDLLDHVNAHSSTPYYLGHFLFERKAEDEFEYAVIDGQQRLTTTVIFISALYKRLKEIRKTENIEDFGDDLYVAYCNAIKQGSSYRFSTVGYDNQVFRDYVIDQTVATPSGWDTVSQKRIAKAFDFSAANLPTRRRKSFYSFWGRL